MNWDLYWNPRLSLENVIGEPKEQLWHTVTFDNLGQAIICEKRRVTGAFLEFMELYQFPFDTQVLPVGGFIVKNVANVVLNSQFKLLSVVI